MKINSVTKYFLFFGTLFFVALSHANQKSMVITIDDLPFVGEYRNFHLAMIIDTLTKNEVPATGFIIASEVRENNWDLLQKFKDSGFGLGNHTYSHANLNQLQPKEYMHQIKAADDILSRVMTEPKYFRYPYLAMSNGKKKEAILCYLAQKNYQVAPITIDSKDFAFNQRLMSVPEADRRAYLTELKPFYLDFIWAQTLKAEEHTQYHHNPDQAQILLIHANLLNAYVLPDIIELYKQKGYSFTSLENGLKTFKETYHCTTPQPKLVKNTTKPRPKTNQEWQEPQEIVQTEPNPDIETYFDWD